jgi:phage terminase large subunit-like protein
LHLHHENLGNDIDFRTVTLHVEVNMENQKCISEIQVLKLEEELHQKHEEIAKLNDDGQAGKQAMLRRSGTWRRRSFNRRRRQRT